MNRAPQLAPAAETGECRLSNDALLLRLPDVFARPDAALCRGFLSRVLSLEFVREIDLHPALGAAEIKFTAMAPQASVLDSIARVLRSEPGNALAERLYLGRTRPLLRIFRYGSAVSTWEVLHQLPGRVRLRHAARAPRRSTHVNANAVPHLWWKSLYRLAGDLLQINSPS